MLVAIIKNMKFTISYMGIKIYQVDAFTEKHFSGNSAAVCVLEEEVSDSWMQNVATEMNLSETAFLNRLDDVYSLRWFTPTTEVDLCGHATLASAHVLWEDGFLEPEQVAQFQTKSGILKASKNVQLIELDFPSDPEVEAPMPQGLIEALGVSPVYLGRNRCDYLVELGSEEILRSLDPDMSILKEVPTRGVIVTAASKSNEYDFISRFFAPASGIDEDPVTGSAHCCLGPFWYSKLGKDEMVAYQASKRGGVVYISLIEDRVILGGKAVTVFRGEMA